MKRLFPLFLLLTALGAIAATSPYMPALDARLVALEAGSGLTTGSVTSAKILDGTIVAADIASDAVEAAEIAAGAVGTSEIATDGVDSAEIAASAVGAAEIAAGAITEADTAAQTSSGLHLMRIARATLDCTDGSTCPVGATSLGVALPANSVIIRSFLRIHTAFTDTGTCTVAISCEDANNIKTATDFTGLSGLVEGESTGSMATAKQSIASACNITATVADGGSCVPTAGKATIWVQYVVHD